MTVTSEQLGGESEDSARRQSPPNVVVVTEHQVLLGSAMAITAPARQERRLHRCIHVVQRVLPWSSVETVRDRPKRRSYPQRTPMWYSDALMAREMYRL